MTRVYADPVEVTAFGADDRPALFTWRGHLYTVTHVGHQWLSGPPERRFWLVWATNGRLAGVFELRHDVTDGGWLLSTSSPHARTAPAALTAEAALSATDCKESTAMSILSDAEHRAAIIDGLRCLATYLEDHPDVPVGLSVTMHYSASARQHDDAAALAAVDKIADLLGVTAESSQHGHYTATKHFGPVRYTTHAVPKAEMRRQRALESYADNVTPDGGAA